MKMEETGSLICSSRTGSFIKSKAENQLAFLYCAVKTFFLKEKWQAYMEKVEAKHTTESSAYMAKLLKPYHCSNITIDTTVKVF